ncbi:MAG TPA: cytidylate kinase-like family protein [Isosphaeraceae bacterium]|nr:cytidylate kinase-like family protein [Isosphaeraceae bacterium]
MAARPAESTRATDARRRGPGGLHRWPQSVVRWLFGTANQPDEPRPEPIPVARFQNLCVSREAGAGGGALARLVGQRMGWKVYDEELVEAIAHRMQVPLDEVRALDELAPSVVQDWLLPLREEYYAPQEAYLDHLAKLIEAIGRAGESILVGRGAGFMLPRETTLTIRVIAPLRERALRLAERMGVSVRTARRAARDLDRRRAQFDRTMHRANVNDPHNFDLVLDTHSLGLEIAAEVVVQTIEIGRTIAPAQDIGLHARPETAYSKPDSTSAAVGSLDEVDGPRAAARAADPAIPPADNTDEADEKRDLPGALLPSD